MMHEQRLNSRGLLLLLVCFALFVGGTLQDPVVYKYELVTDYPHDPAAFTQGLLYDRECHDNLSKQCYDILWESTGLYGSSTVRKVNLSSGRVLQRTSIPRQFFGEGLARLHNRLYQLTWRQGAGFAYDVHSLAQLSTFDTGLRDGWGLTTDGELLVASDGSDRLFWLHPGNWSTARSVRVTDGGTPIPWVNELEMINGEIWANVWQTDCIARIDTGSGHVRGWVLMHGLLDLMVSQGHGVRSRMDVLNGIAWDGEGKRVFITGKQWPRMFELKVVEVAHTKAVLEQARRSCWPRRAGG